MFLFLCDIHTPAGNIRFSALNGRDKGVVIADRHFHIQVQLSCRHKHKVQVVTCALPAFADIAHRIVGGVVVIAHRAAFPLPVPGNQHFSLFVTIHPFLFQSLYRTVFPKLLYHTIKRGQKRAVFGKNNSVFRLGDSFRHDTEPLVCADRQTRNRLIHTYSVHPVFLQRNDCVRRRRIIDKRIIMAQRAF